METNESAAGGNLNAICYWCDKAIRFMGYRRLAVCGNCQSLLRGAGLKDSEIFVEPERERPAIIHEHLPDAPPQPDGETKDQLSEENETSSLTTDH